MAGVRHGQHGEAAGRRAVGHVRRRDGARLEPDRLRLDRDAAAPGHGVPSVEDEVHQRLLDSSIARTLSWNPTTKLDVGMAATYDAYRDTLTSNAPSESKD